MNDTDTLLHEVALTLFPNVGPQLTRQLMSYAGSARNALHLPAGKLLKIPGVGPKTVELLVGRPPHGGPKPGRNGVAPGRERGRTAALLHQQSVSGAA